MVDVIEFEGMDDIEEEELLAIALLHLNLQGDGDAPMVDEKRWCVVPVDVEAFRRMGDPSFRLHFRMDRATFEALYEVVGDHMVREQLMQRQRIPLDLMLMHALWILATPDSFRSVALQFGVHPNTVHSHYIRIISALCDLAPQYITWPNANKRQAIADAFERYSGFPGIIGCIDGTLVVCTAPTIQPRRYIDRHDQYSFNVQAVCDHNLAVMDIHVGEVGSMSDARVFRRSPLCRKLLTDPTMLEPNQHLIGDSIYPLTDKLIKPFRDNGHLTREQRLFNYLLCRCRARIEHCFGRLFSQWRRLKFLHCFDVEFAVETIVASFVLHNFMILNGEGFAEEEVHCHPEVERDEMLEDIVDGYDELPEEFLRRHPLVRLMQIATDDGRDKQRQLMEHVQHVANRVII